jgi:hypothetical protein
MKLDPDDGQAVTGLGIALAILGDAEQGIRIVNDASDRFTHDDIFAYNAACVYGRALEAIPKDSPADEQQKLRRDYSHAAISCLQRSLELGFEDRDWMKADPDLASLRDHEEFKKLLLPNTGSTDPPRNDAEGKTESKQPKTKPDEGIEP